MDPFHQASNPYGRLPIPGLLSVLARILTPSRAKPSAAQADIVELDEWRQREAARGYKLWAPHFPQVPAPPLKYYPPETFITPGGMSLRRKRQGGDL